jgi:hypothetical protein
MASSASPAGQQPQAKKDILLLGATGFMGRIITKYLCTHVQKELFTVALGARSPDKLEQMVKELGVKEKVDEFVKVDVGSPESVERAVENARVVINVVGPYWTWGTPVVAYVVGFDNLCFYEVLLANWMLLDEQGVCEAWSALCRLDGGDAVD